MKYYSETRHYIRRSRESTYMEDKEVRCEKHEISEAAYKLFTEEIYADVKSKFNNADGSVTYSIIQNSNEAEEITFWVEA